MRNQPLKCQIRLWTVLLIALPSLLIMGIYTIGQIKIVTQKNLEMLNQQVEFQERLITYWIDDRANDVRKISQLEIFQSLDESQIESTLNKLQQLSKDFDSLSYIDKNGLFQVSTLSNGIRYRSAVGKPYYEAAVAGKEYISDVVIGRNSGLPIINIAAPIYNKQGEFQGLILGSVRTTTIETLLRDDWIGQTGEILLINRAGVMIAAPRYVNSLIDQGVVDETSKLLISLTPEMMKKFELNYSGSYIDYLDNQVFAAYRYIPERDWMLIGQINQAEVLAPMYEQLMIMAGVTICLILLIIPLATLITNRIKKPIDWLIDQAKLVSEKQYKMVGQEGYLDKMPIELVCLCEAFIKMSREVEANIDLIQKNEAKLATQMIEIHLVNRTLAAEIHERRKAQAALQELNAMLEDQVTERTLELRKNEHHFRTLVENNLAVICRFDRNYRLVYANPMYETATGRSVEQDIGKTCEEIAVMNDCSQWTEHIETAFVSACSGEFETLDSLQNGGRCYLTQLIPEYNLDGQVESVLSVSLDITSQKKTEAILQQNAKRLKEILNQCPIDIVVVDKNGMIEAMNDSLVSIVPGRTHEDCIGQSYFEVIAKAGYSKEESPIQWALQGVATNNRAMHRAGRDWIFNVTPIYDNEQITGAIGMYQDMTEALKRERERIEVLQRFETMFSCNVAAMAVVRLGDKKIVDVNPAWERLYGFQKSEVIGRSPDDLGILQPLESPLKLKTAIQGEEMTICSKDGSVRHVMLSAALMNVEGESCVLATTIDVTVKHRVEKEMAHLDRLNIVGEMAASIGHEVRNPMTTVRGYLQLFQRKRLFEPYYEQFSLMIEELDRANAIITEFLSLAKNKVFEIKRGNINDVVNTLFPLMQADALRMGHEVCVELSAIPDSDFSEKEIRQMLLNFVRNALEAMVKSGVATIRTYADDEHLYLEIQDTGIGIPDEIMNKLGTPFVTTKENGTGLGLPVCYRIAERHKAKIQVSTGLAGTKVSVVFPTR
ncbi:PAS domain S-box protein [bacterium BFN5]|nr:PAS domain S-box protein [bacterium BFN5]QJW46822.1 PAS domain S-box protein [bacterium BFN5]